MGEMTVSPTGLLQSTVTALKPQRSFSYHGLELGGLIGLN
jgi:hypothetical protein